MNRFNREKEIIVGYDKSNGEDMSCLILAKRIDKNITVQEEFYGKEAEAVYRALRMIKGNYILIREKDLNNGKIRKTVKFEREQYNEFKNKYINQPITFLTEENLEKLEKHCEKAIHYERGHEHQITLELIQRYKELQKENKKLKEDIKYIYKVQIENRNKLLDDSIQKSVLREKIKELENKSGGNTYHCQAVIDAQKRILQRILEEK